MSEIVAAQPGVRHDVEQRRALCRGSRFSAAAPRGLRHRLSRFKWPKLDRFNWALDYFDAIARGNAQPALWLVDEDAGETKLSFAQLSERSNRIANYLRGLGVRRGDRILLMLGNVVPLWECMLAAMKLGAVIVPATTLLTRNDLADRFARGRVRHVVTSADAAAKFADLPGDYSRIAIGGEAPGWMSYEKGYEASAAIYAGRRDACADDPMLLYFTSGTTATPKLVLHSHQSYPVGHLSTMYWIGLQPGDVHLNISSPGWAKHAWSCFFAPWNAQAVCFHRQPEALQRQGSARHRDALRRDHVLRAADSVAHADPGGSCRPGRCRCAN